MKHPTPEQLAAFHDGTADARTLVAVEEHVGECVTCQDVLAALERGDRALRATLSHEPGDDHFEMLAARIEKRLGAEAGRARAPALGRALAAAGEAASLALTALARWLASFWNGLKAFHAPEWAGALGALVVAAGLVLINMRHTASPALRNPALEQRAGQAAGGAGEADELSRGAAPPAAPERDKEHAAETRARREIAPATIRPPAPGALQKQEAERAYIVKRSPSGEEGPPREPGRAFAKAPPAAPGEAQKPRPGMLEENRPRVEGGAQMAKKDVASRNEAAPAQGAANGNEAAPAPASAPAPAAAKVLVSAQAEARSDQAPVRLCGVVKDARGRAVPNASVTLVSRGSGVSTDAQGRFCIDAPPGPQSLSVIAVGFDPLHLDVDVAADSPPLALTLLTVQVLEGTPEQVLTRDRLRMLGGTAQTGAPGAALRMPPDSLEIVETHAMRLTLEAERAPSVARYESAAAEWVRVRDHTAGLQNLEARFRVAEARYRAYLLDPTTKHGMTADEALTSYLVRAPLGARRDTATVWLGRVRP